MIVDLCGCLNQVLQGIHAHLSGECPKTGIDIFHTSTFLPPLPRSIERPTADNILWFPQHSEDKQGHIMYLGPASVIAARYTVADNFKEQLRFLMETFLIQAGCVWRTDSNDWNINGNKCAGFERFIVGDYAMEYGFVNCACSEQEIARISALAGRPIGVLPVSKDVFMRYLEKAIEIGGRYELC